MSHPTNTPFAGDPNQPGVPAGSPSPGAGQPMAPPPGMPAYGYQPPAATPPKKKRKWPWILGGVVVLIILIAALSGGGGESDSSSESTGAANSSAADGSGDDTSSNTDAEDAADQTPGLDTPVRDGKFEFTVTGVETGLSEVGTNPYLAQKAQGQFVVITMTVKNIGDKPQGFTPSAQKLTDSQGRIFDADTSAQIALGDSDISVWDSINPGNSVVVKVVYDMPADATPSTIDLHDSIFSGGATVALK